MTREEAIKYLIEPVSTSTSDGEEKQKEFEAYKMAIKALEQQKTGKWLPLENGNPYWRRCSECDAHRRMFDYLEHYCPSCGAKMQVE